MGIGIFFAVAIFFSIIGFLKSLRKERKRRELAESVLKPLLEKTFGTYDHYADRCLPRQEVEGLVRGDPHGHDLVEAMYKDSKVRFCSMHFTEDDRDEDGHTQTYEVYRGQCVVIEKENFTFYKADIADRKMIYDIFEKEQPDVVINFAAESHVDRSILDPEVF